MIVLLVGGGLLLGSHFWTWGLLIWFIAGTTHPPAAHDYIPLGGGRKLLAAVTFILLLAIVLPVPGVG